MALPVAAAIVGGSLLSGLMADQAADTQANAARLSADESRRQYDLNRKDSEPWRKAGELSLTRLLGLMGLGGNGLMPTREQFTTTTPATRGVAYQPAAGLSVQYRGGSPGQTTFDEAGYNAAMGRYQQPPGDDYGALMKQFTGQDLLTEPGYQFGLAEGEKGINRAALARGGYDSGTTLKALLKYNQDYAGTKYDQAFSRDQAQKSQTYNMLSGISGTGQVATRDLALTGADLSRQYGQATMAAGDARAAGLVGVGNAINSGLSTYLNYSQGQSLLDALKTR